MDITTRFLEYAVISSNSDENSLSHPSSEKQFDVLKLLEKQLSEEGFSNIKLTPNGHIYACLPANTDEKITPIGFIAHVDTSEDASDVNISPRIIKYEGGDIILNEKLGIKTTVEEYPNIQNYVGQHLIVTDGTTLLGSDDKAGVAEIMDAMIKLKNSDKKHGDIWIAFTSDEEVGNGTYGFDFDSFKAEYAYTVDGGTLGEIEYENFNAAYAKITITGASIHPGSAKNKMINAIQVAFELNSLFPSWERPEHTENREGFILLNGIQGDVAEVKMKYIIRDFDKTLFEKKKKRILEAIDFINAGYGKKIVDCEMRDSYYNMCELIKPHYHIVERIENAMKKCDVTPIIVPIRGGTDGARLSFDGLLCPNICTGGENFHGNHEFVSIESMEKVSDIIIAICTDFN